MPDSGPVPEFRIARDTGRAGEVSEVIVPPGHLTLRVLLDTDHRVRVADDDGPGWRAAGRPHGGHPCARHGVEHFRGWQERPAIVTADVQQLVVVFMNVPRGMVGFHDVDGFCQRIVLDDHADEVHYRVGIDGIPVLVRERRGKAGDYPRVGVREQVRHACGGFFIHQHVRCPPGRGPVLVHEIGRGRGPTRHAAAQLLRDVVPVQVLQGSADDGEPALIT